mgnify:CR=1 FL=1
MSRVILSHIALFTANLIYALNYLFAKDVMPDYIGPKAFVLIRVFVGAFIFWLIHSLFIVEKIEKKDMLYILICALFGVVINMLCFFEGLNITTPINASLIMITTPLIVYLISSIIFKKERTYKKFFGVILGLVGAMLLISDGNSHFRLNNMGDLLVFINAASYAIYLILIKSMMKKYQPVTILKTLFSIGFLIILPMAFNEFLEINFNTIPGDIILKILFVVLCTTCLAYFLNIYALSNVRASTVAFYIYLQPLLATALSILWGKDVLTLINVCSAALIFAGVYFVLIRRPI